VQQRIERGVIPESSSAAATLRPVPRSESAETEPAAPRLATRDLDAYFGAVHAVRGVTLEFEEHRVTAIIGP
jgi:hypothetical protein